jgi:hypothetical protein
VIWALGMRVVLDMCPPRVGGIDMKTPPVPNL